MCEKHVQTQTEQQQKMVSMFEEFYDEFVKHWMSLSPYRRKQIAEDSQPKGFNIVYLTGQQLQEKSYSIQTMMNERVFTSLENMKDKLKHVCVQALLDECELRLESYDPSKTVLWICVLIESKDGKFCVFDTDLDVIC